MVVTVQPIYELVADIVCRDELTPFVELTLWRRNERGGGSRRGSRVGCRRLGDSSGIAAGGRVISKIVFERFRGRSGAQEHARKETPCLPGVDASFFEDADNRDDVADGGPASRAKNIVTLSNARVRSFSRVFSLLSTRATVLLSEPIFG